MLNRAHIFDRPQARFCPLWPFARGSRRRFVRRRHRRTADCSTCHEQAQKLAKSAHAGLTCDTCHESHEKYPHPAGIPKPACTTCHADQAGDYARGVARPGRKSGNEGAPDCALCHGSAHELLPPEIPGIPHRRSGYLRHVPHAMSWNSTAPACTARRWRAASRRRRCAPIATASTRSSSTPTPPRR